MTRLVLFSLLLVGGESVLLPALRLELESEGDLLTLVGLAIFAGLTSDLFWYGVGRHGARFPLIAESAIVKRVRRRRWLPAERFEAHWMKLLVLSKFVYGTRTSAQIACGATNRSLPRYLAVNTFATSLLVGYLGALIVLFTRSFVSMGLWPNVVSTIAATALVSLLVGKGAWFVFRHSARA